MFDPAGETETSKLPDEVKIGSVLTGVGAFYVLVQHTSLAPFPHAADDFVAGFTVGVAIVGVAAWVKARITAPKIDSMPTFPQSSPDD